MYEGGGGQHKILYTTYYNLPNIHYFIFNEKWENVPKLSNWTHYFYVKEKNINLSHQWRYGNYLSSFSMKGERFLRSQEYIFQILGAIQKIIDRVSSAIIPHYEAIGQAARSSEINHIDETSYSKKNVLQWLWVMTNTMVAFFMIHPNRSKEAFKALIGDWVGILVSDGYGRFIAD